MHSYILDKYNISKGNDNESKIGRYRRYRIPLCVSVVGMMHLVCEVVV